jgi:hypothetical protein
MINRRLLLPALMLLCTTALLWRAGRLSLAWQESRGAEADLAAAQAAQADIDRLSRLPATAIAPDAGDADILHEVEQTLSAAGLPAASVKELALEPPVTLAAQGVTRHAGRVSLEKLPLDQLGRTLALWSTRLRPCRIDRLDLAATPTGSDNPAAVYRVSIGFSALAPLAERTGAPR